MRMQNQGTDPLAGLRVRAPAEIETVLRQLIEGGTALHLSAPDGCCYTTRLNLLEAPRRRIGFVAEPLHPQLQHLLDLNEASAVGFLDSVKLQFELQHLVLAHGGRSCTLLADMPQELFRFQRRNSFRVRTPERGTPTAWLYHPALPDTPLSLRVLDVSAEGCALFLPNDVPPLTPGMQLDAVRLELDADTRLQATLQVQHVTALSAQGRGVRLGCALVGASGEAHRALQRYIDHTQKRRRVLALDD
jgi:flagellar brake protein